LQEEGLRPVNSAALSTDRGNEAAYYQGIGRGCKAAAPLLSANAWIELSGQLTQPCAATIASMDAGAQPMGMYLWPVSALGSVNDAI